METLNPGSRKEKQCDICSRRFARSEHLTRHRLTHTRERPYVCNLCHRSFQRADVKALHIKKCRGASPDQRLGHKSSTGSSRKRVRLACNRCRQKKVACDGQEPCAHCRNAPFDCEYVGPRDQHEASPEELGQNISWTSPVGDHCHSESSNAMPTIDSTGASMSPHDLSLAQDSHNIGLMPASDQNAHIMMPEVVQAGLDLSLSATEILDPMSMNDIWQIPALDTQFWLDGSDLSWNETSFDPALLMPEYSTVSVPQQRITGIMQEYFDRKSRRSSPSAPDKASVMWYSAPPNLDDHDEDILNVFVNLFHKYISPTFPIFGAISSARNTRPEFVLAMAATGGLFCSVPGSPDVAKSLYNDSRRLLLASHHPKIGSVNQKCDRMDKLLALGTFILLQLYGICSGDKRSYEFVEAFNGDLIHAVKDYSHACLMSKDAKKNGHSALLLQSLYILDCYRVIIMHRPPCFPWRHTNSFADPASSDEALKQLCQFPAALTNHRALPSNIHGAGYCLSSLASLSGYLWAATTQAEIADPEGTDDKTSQLTSLWKADFFEVACENWLHSCKEPPLFTVVVYHHMHIMMHANLVVVQRFAHSSSNPTARDPQRNAVAKAVNSWIQSRDYEVARWHANQLISAIEGAVSTSRSNPAQPDPRSEPSSSKPSEARKCTFEAPHTPFAVYFASLVLWCGELASTISSSSMASARAHLVRGETILSAHRARSAKLLARVLIEIK